ncbi:hypothetical protein BJY04DRAFT_214388 [Aspergillus karnatakaensis]|uniref:uncharacterized protein n=1 Tax=Aspergillus karnatakaensis TaxID=1810916 RepID=UPI003CCDC487
MPDFEAPNWARNVLVVLTTLSFIPQLRRLAKQKNSLGLSSSYVLCNLIVATEQITLLFCLMVTFPEDSGKLVFVHDPRNAGDWINLAQVAISWLGWLAVFLLTIRYRPTSHAKSEYKVLYTLFALISLIPLFVDLIGLTYLLKHFWEPQDIRSGFFLIHILLVNPFMIPLAAVSLLPQMAQIWKHIGDPVGYPGFSVAGLVVQAVLEGVLAVSWVWRVEFEEPRNVLEFEWFWGVGWIVVQSGILAGVKGVLGVVWGWRWIVMRLDRRGKDIEGGEDGTEEEEGSGGEREPLLGQ